MGEKCILVKTFIKTILHSYLIYYVVTTLIWIVIIFHDMFFAYNQPPNESSFLLFLFFILGTLISNAMPAMFIGFYQDNLLLFLFSLIGTVIIYKGYRLNHSNYKLAGSTVILFSVLLVFVQDSGLFYRSKPYTYSSPDMNKTDSTHLPVQKVDSKDLKYEKRKELIKQDKENKGVEHISYPEKLIYQEAKKE